MDLFVVHVYCVFSNGLKIGGVTHKSKYQIIEQLKIDLIIILHWFRCTEFIY